MSDRAARALFWALAMFIGINFALNIIDGVKPFSHAALSAQYLDYKGAETAVSKLPKLPNVLLLGSSLVVDPMWYADQAVKFGCKDPCHYHFARNLQKYLAEAGLKDAEVYDLAVAGSLVSDSYLLFHHYLQSNRQPSIVIIDCAPRSFFDGGLVRPNDTDIFYYCFGLSDFIKMKDIYLPQPGSKVDYALAKLFFMYHQRRWLAEQVTNAIATAVRDKSATPASTHSQTNVAASPLTFTPASFDQSLDEYKGRYNLISIQQIARQLQFLTLLGKDCADRKIQLFVVNMPLTEQNKQLLPKNFYSNFVNTVKTALPATTHFIDLTASQSWSRDEFCDSAHLNEKGGTKLNQLLAKTIQQELTAANSAQQNSLR